MSTAKCPSCASSDVGVLDSQRAVCGYCSKVNRRVFQFCCDCQREWPRDASSTSACMLPDCALRAALLSDTKISDPFSSARGCPFFRACPKCKALLTHNGKGCPNITCPHCHTYFCFRCLSRRCIGLMDFDIDYHIDYFPQRGPLRHGHDISICRVVDNSLNF
ncbi:E3 ubiquitin-protein ligase lubel-like isoform X1 [Danio aesculapii]|uniref:E3 ubiquitin-protein ligase lubel-like isoform X1 n=1 Tax=Danio aesculapii TaxID=1142201 RepID=UPI0024BFC701|nr:E3 ubiquitin-protein ligase lubel-like isoform X1 [Danio aesculapii]